VEQDSGEDRKEPLRILRVGMTAEFIVREAIMKTKHIIAISAGIFALVLLSAGASALITRDTLTADKPETHKVATVTHRTTSHANNNIRWNDNRTASTVVAQPAQPRCNDGNVVGYVAGGVGGGLLGSQLGKGNGSTVGAIAGTLGGAYLGGQYLPTQNITCASR
jgi:uncharacterized protein YcfJ